MSKLSVECEKISAFDKQPENPFKVKYERRDDLREELGRTRYSELHLGDDPRSLINPLG